MKRPTSAAEARKLLCQLAYGERGDDGVAPNIKICSGENDQEKVFVIWDSHASMSKMHDAWNQAVNAEAWAPIRKHILEYAEKDAAADLARTPQIHPSNLLTDHPFAQLRFGSGPNGERIPCCGGQAPYLVPDGIEEIEDLEWVEGMGFTDDTDACDGCGRAIGTQPDCYFWRPDYWESDGDILCRRCVGEDPSEYLEERLNTSDPVNDELVELEGRGFEKVDLEFEVGMHKGMDDDIGKVQEALNKLRDSTLFSNAIEYVFTNDPSQFYTTWFVWVRWSEEHDYFKDRVSAASLMKQYLEKCDTKLPYDPATEIEKALKHYASPTESPPSAVYEMKEMRIDEKEPGYKAVEVKKP